MKTKDDIIQAIERIAFHAPVWTIGVTADVEGSLQEHNTPKFWYQWKAELETEAKAVQKSYYEHRSLFG